MQVSVHDMKTATNEPIQAEALAVVPANESSWDDLVAIFGIADYPAHCQCQRLKVPGGHAHRLRLIR